MFIGSAVIIYKHLNNIIMFTNDTASKVSIYLVFIYQGDPKITVDSG